MSTATVTATTQPMPFWQATPCADWCVDQHADSDHPDDRSHTSGYVAEFPLTHEVLSVEDLRAPDFRPPTAMIVVERHETEASARVVVIKDERPGLNLSQSEAIALRDALTAALEVAQQASI